MAKPSDKRVDDDSGPGQVIEDYLKAVYRLSEDGTAAQTSAISRSLGVAPPSVTAMIKKLAEMGLARHEPYRGITLTRRGERLALRVIRHHRLIELFLAEVLGVSWDAVHHEAEKWEHVLSAELEQRIDELLGHPTTDPHGAPIPDRQGKIERPATVRLSKLRIGQAGVIAEVDDHSPELLRYLGERGLYPATKVRVVNVEPFDGPIVVRVRRDTHQLGLGAARHVRIRDVHEARGGRG